MVSAGSREEGFAAFVAVMTDANKQCNWLGSWTPNFTIGSAVSARVFRAVFYDESRGLHFAGSADVLSAMSAPARILTAANEGGRVVRGPSITTERRGKTKAPQRRP